MDQLTGVNGPKFSRIENRDFDQTLKKRVRAYFKDNNLSKFGGRKLLIKTFAMLAIYFVPYFILVSGVFTNNWLIMLCWVTMGVGMAGIGMGIMHDANHGAYSKNEPMNGFLGKIIMFVGGFATNWKIQHNILHHSYTNIEGLDEDVIAPFGLMRFSPNEKLKKAHRFQHWYAWFFYGFMTLAWSTFKDFGQILRYQKAGLIETQNKKFTTLFTGLVLNKLIYFAFILLIPMLFVPTSWWMVLIGFLVMHFVAGLILATIFQLAHVVSDTHFPSSEKALEDLPNWSVHQLSTTSNFAPDSKIMNWFIGGLNFQIEHHLFPNICHVHYKNLSKIVRETAAEFNIPYYCQPTFFRALANHTRILKQLGRTS